MTVPMRRWTPRRMLRHLAALNDEITPTHPGAAMFCTACSESLDDVVYSGGRGELTIWPFLCADCAADWINLGGRIALRWAR